LDIYTACHISFSVELDGVISEGMDEIAHIEQLDFEFLDVDKSKEFGRMEWFQHYGTRGPIVSHYRGREEGGFALIECESLGKCIQYQRYKKYHESR